MADAFDLRTRQVYDKRAVFDLTSKLRAGGTTALTRRKDAEGRWLITYATNIPLANNYDDVSSDLKSINDAQNAALKRAMHEIEQVANVRFVEATTPGEMAQADIRIQQGKMKHRFKGVTKMDAPIRDIMIDSAPEDNFAFGRAGYSYIQHELLHALGLSHPGSLGLAMDDGKDPLYNKDSTIMSYIESFLAAAAVLGLGPFDVAALQATYGKAPGLDKVKVIDGDTLPDRTVLVGTQPLTIEFSGEKIRAGQISIDLASLDFSRHITGLVNHEGKGAYVHVRIVPGTQVEHVLASEHFKGQLFMAGNALPNHLRGGAGSDQIEARGGSDRLTGGGGVDTFIVSGTKNIITDYGDHPQEDIAMRDKNLRVTARYHERFMLEGNAAPGTLVLMQDAQGTIQSSVFVMNKKPEEIRFTHLSNENGTRITADVTPQYLAASMTDHEGWELLPSPKTPAVSANIKREK